ncbi:MAG: ribonuclease P protein component [Porphyromonas sp.]|nr:ribonuclease P protein component [Porphyromonas sp.]
MPGTPHSLPKQERLYLRERIARLYREGSSFVSYPLRILWLAEEKMDEEAHLCMMVSVAKRRFKRANKRNRVKRLVREAHRLRKPSLMEKLCEQGLRVDVAYMMISDDLPEYDTIARAVTKAFARIEKELSL